MKTGRLFLDNFLRIGMFITAVAMAAGTVWLGVIDKTGGAAITATLCVCLCTFVFLSRFKRFKGLGFEGELWEQEMEKAAEIRRALKDLSERVAENVFWQLGPGSRWGGGNAETILGIIERTDRNLEAVGIDRQSIEELKRPWHKCMMGDLAKPIIERAGSIAAEKLGPLDAELAAIGSAIPAGRMEEYAAIQEKRTAMTEVKTQLGKLAWRDDYENVPRLLREAIDGYSWMTGEDRQAVYRDCAEGFRDIDHYLSHRTVRRPEVLKI